MKEPQTNICPLLAIAGAGGTNNPAVCIEERCAWWTISHCAVLDITFSLDELAQKEAPASAANADEGKETQHDHESILSPLPVYQGRGKECKYENC